MDVKVPAMAESITEADVGAWLKKDGEHVSKGDALVELQTDKASVELQAEEDGVLRVVAAEGETVKVGQVLARIEGGGAPTSPREPAPERRPDAKPDAAPKAPPREERAPAAKQPRREEAAQVAEPPRPEPPAAPAQSPAPSPEPAAARPADEPGTRREKMSRLRRRIAERLVEAQRQAAILTTFNQVDMSAILDLRRANQEWFEKRHGVRLGFVSLFGRAAVAALAETPRLNAFIEGDEIVHHDFVHLGVAVGTERGLVVPVVRHAERLSLAELETEIQRLAKAAREGKLPLEDLAGGTFTISNGGVYGSLLSTPILNPPQSGILGMHAIEKRAVVVDDAVVVRPMMYVALSYDHRLVDGEEAVTFLVKLKQRLEAPDRMLLEA